MSLHKVNIGCKFSEHCQEFAGPKSCSLELLDLKILYASSLMQFNTEYKCGSLNHLCSVKRVLKGGKIMPPPLCLGTRHKPEVQKLARVD